MHARFPGPQPSTIANSGFVKVTGLPKRTAPLEGAPIVSEEAEHALNVAVAYQNPLTGKWAEDACKRVAQLVGMKYIHSAAWEISDLTRPENLCDAVRFATLADVIVVSVCASEELPPDLYAWIDAWLPRRHRRAGALVALIGVSEQSCPWFSRTLDYLQAVAHSGHLDFLPRECKLPAGLHDFHFEQTAENNRPQLAATTKGVQFGGA